MYLCMFLFFLTLNITSACAQVRNNEPKAANMAQWQNKEKKLGMSQWSWLITFPKIMLITLLCRFINLRFTTALQGRHEDIKPSRANDVESN